MSAGIPSVQYLQMIDNNTPFLKLHVKKIACVHREDEE